MKQAESPGAGVKHSQTNSGLRVSLLRVRNTQQFERSPLALEKIEIKMENDDAIGYTVLIIVTCFIPTIIAHLRGHNSRSAIGSLNFLTVAGTIVSAVFSIVVIGLPLFGLASIFWFAALVWSLTGNTRHRDRRRARMDAREIALALARFRIVDRLAIAKAQSLSLS
jgi:hypothetical protein